MSRQSEFDSGDTSKTRSLRAGSRLVPALKTCVLLFLTLSAAWNAFADPTTPDHALAAVRGWLRMERTPLQTAMGQKTRRVDTFKDAQGTADPLRYGTRPSC